jgi:hypothetical protein
MANKGSIQSFLLFIKNKEYIKSIIIVTGTIYVKIRIHVLTKVQLGILYFVKGKNMLPTSQSNQVLAHSFKK